MIKSRSFRSTTQGRRSGDGVPAGAQKSARRLSAATPAQGRSAPTVPPLSAFEAVLKGSDGREISTTMAFVRILTALVRDKNIGKHVVPIVPDEARTFGMEGMFRQLGIYSSEGQKYEPVDRDQVMYYRETKAGRSSKKASTRREPSRRGLRRRPPTAPPTSSRYRSTFFIRCSVCRG